MTGRLQDKVAVITGSSSGIGRAIALRYSDEGAHVVCADLKEAARAEGNPEEAKITTHDLINQQGGKATFVKVDVTVPEEVENLVNKAVEWGGRLDVMVNNAGIAVEGTKPGPIWECSVETWDLTNKINIFGVFLGTKYATAQMLKQEPHSSGDRGWVINTASILGLVASPGAPAYCASKGAVVNLTRSAALACGPKRIHVNAICPGYTTSALTSPLYSNPDLIEQIKKLHPFGERMGEPEDLARVAVFLASDDARWVNGCPLTVDGGFTAQ